LQPGQELHLCTAAGTEAQPLEVVEVVMVFIRLYRFHRRSGMSVTRAAVAAFNTLRRWR
jgi:hypothetical protein